MRFVGDDQIEVGRRKELLVFVVEEQRLHGGDDDLGVPPVVAVFLVDDRLVVVGQQRGEGLLRLIFQFQPIDQEQDAPGVAGAQKELDDGGGGQRLAGAGGHFEQEAVLAVPDRCLQRVDGFQLIGAQEAQLVGPDEIGPLGFILPRGFGVVAGPLGEHDVVVADRFLDQPLRIGRDLLVADHRLRRWGRW